MVDRTKEDISQDFRISNLEKEVRELREKVATLIGAAERHGAALKQLEPLVGLVEFAESIKAHFSNYRIR